QGSTDTQCFLQRDPSPRFLLGDGPPSDVDLAPGGLPYRPAGKRGAVVVGDFFDRGVRCVAERLGVGQGYTVLVLVVLLQLQSLADDVHPGGVGTGSQGPVPAQDSSGDPSTVVPIPAPDVPRQARGAFRDDPEDHLSDLVVGALVLSDDVESVVVGVVVALQDPGDVLYRGFGEGPGASCQGSFSQDPAVPSDPVGVLDLPHLLCCLGSGPARSGPLLEGSPDLGTLLEHPDRVVAGQVSVLEIGVAGFGVTHREQGGDGLGVTPGLHPCVVDRDGDP